MHTLTIDYPPEVLWALQQEPAEFEAEARLLLALKLYEMGRLATGLAAQLAGIPRITFMFILGQHALLYSFSEQQEGDTISWRQRFGLLLSAQDGLAAPMTTK